MADTKSLPPTWQLATIEDAMAAIIDYRGKTPEKTGFGVPLVTAKIVKAGRIMPPDEFIAEKDYDAWMRRGKVHPGDVVVTTEAPLGEVAQLDERRVALAQRLIALRGKPELVNNTFLRFSMQSAFVQNQLHARASGTTVLGIRQSELRKVELALPPLPEQRAIAGVLGDKIEVNRKTARVLEGIARAVFTSWFVDFDPVRRPEASRLPADIAALFPKRLVESAMGEVQEIPEGWAASTLTDHFNLTMGQSPPGSTYNETGEGMPFYQGRTDYGFRFPTPRVYCTAPTRLAEPGDTLVSVRAPVGDVNMAIERCAVGRGVAAVRHKSGSRSLTYYAMHALRAHFLRFEADGTVFGAIGKVDFERLPFVAPPPQVVAAFEQFAGPIDQRIEACERQSATLAALRDALLPKLISGELRIADAETIVGRAV